jgi:hypothetical protein
MQNSCKQQTEECDRPILADGEVAVSEQIFGRILHYLSFYRLYCEKVMSSTIFFLIRNQHGEATLYTLCCTMRCWCNATLDYHGTSLLRELRKASRLRMGRTVRCSSLSWTENSTHLFLLCDRTYGTSTLSTQTALVLNWLQ